MSNPFPPLQPPTKKKKPPAKKPTNPYAAALGGAGPTVPTSGTGKGSQYQQFVDYWASHGYANIKGQVAQSVYLAAKAEHLDPVVYMALILNESGGHFNTKDSSAGAVGVAQLLPSTFIGQPEPWNKKHIITEADLRDPGINLRLGAAYFASLQGSHPADAYGAYNMGPNAAKLDPTKAGQIQTAFWNKWVTPWSPKYVPTSATSPAAAAGQQVPGGTGQQKPDNPVFKNQYVAGVTKQNKFSLTNDPNKALQYDGAPLTRSNFLTLKDQLTSNYVSYTGNRPSNHQIQTYIDKGWNTYTLASLLSKGKNFTSSPIYKQTITAMNSSLKDVLGAGGKIPPELAREAVLNQWDATVVAQKLRALPGYTHSEEYKGNVATLENVHSSIMGTPDAEGMHSIEQAALAGWTTDQYAAWLRSQPTYTQSPEYQTKALGFLSALGLITGSTPVLKPGVSAGPGAVSPSTSSLPNDPRAPLAPYSSPGSQKRAGIPPIPTLGATLSG